MIESPSSDSQVHRINHLVEPYLSYETYIRYICIYMGCIAAPILVPVCMHMHNTNITIPVSYIGIVCGVYAKSVSHENIDVRRTSSCPNMYVDHRQTLFLFRRAPSMSKYGTSHYRRSQGETHQLGHLAPNGCPICKQCHDQPK